MFFIISAHGISFQLYVCVCRDTVQKISRMEKGRKKYVQICEGTSSDEIFALLDAVNSDEEDNIDELINDSDTEYIADEDLDIDLTPEKNDEASASTLLIPEANVHRISANDTDNILMDKADPKEATGNGEKTSSKADPKQTVTTIKWKKNVKPTPRKDCALEGDILHQFPENVRPIEVYETVLKLDVLIDLIVSQSNLYAQQNGRNFITTNEEMKAFLGVNYMMALNQLPKLSLYWDSDVFIGNTGIQNVFIRDRFKEILQNLHFADNIQSDQEDKGYKIRPVIDHLNESFRQVYSDEPEQSIDEHMTKFKGRSSMKQYIKSKPIKWGFKWWYRCASTSGYLYEFDLYLGRKKKVEGNLGESVVFMLSEKLKGTYCTLYFDNFFNSPTLIDKLLKERQIYAIGTVRKDRKQMPTLKADKQMKRGDMHFQQSTNVTCCKWFDNKPVLMLATNVEGMGGTTNVYRRTKGSANKIAVPCPNIIQMYNKGMGGVDLMDQKTAAYRLDRKSKFRFYLRLFFDMMDVGLVNSHIIHTKVGGDLSLLEYKIVVANMLIGRYTNRKRSFPSCRASKRRSLESSVPMDVPNHLPVFLEVRKRCQYCKNEGKDNKTFVSCETCGVHLCCLKERNCFSKYHL